MLRNIHLDIPQLPFYVTIGVQPDGDPQRGFWIVCELMEKHRGGFIGVPTYVSPVAARPVAHDVSRQGRIRVGGVDRQSRCGFWFQNPGLETTKL